MTFAASGSFTGGLGVDLDLFDRHVARLEHLGYARGAAQLTWPLGRMMLHRGDPDMTVLGMHDLNEFRAAIDAFTARLRLEPLREFYARSPDARPPAEIANGYFASAIAKLHALGARAAVQRRPSTAATTRTTHRRRQLGRPALAGVRRRSAPCSSATCSCTCRPTLTGPRRCGTPAMRCAGWSPG